MNQGPRSSAHSMLQMFLNAAQGNQGSRPTAFADGGSVQSPYRTDGYNPYSSAVTFAPYLRPKTVVEMARESVDSGGEGPAGNAGSTAPGSGGTMGSVGLAAMGYGEMGLAPGSMVAGFVGPTMADMAIDQEAATDQAIANAIANNAISSVDVGAMGSEASVGAPGSAVSGAADEGSHGADGNNSGEASDDAAADAAAAADDSDADAGGSSAGDAGDGDGDGGDGSGDGDGGFARGGLVRRFADGGEATDDQVTRNVNDAIAVMLEQYKAGKIGPEQLAAVTGLSVNDITAMFSSSDTSLANTNEKLGEYRPSGPTVMTDENKRIRPDYELRSVPGDMTSPNSRMPMEEWMRRKGIQRSGVNPKTQVFADGGSVTDQGSRDTQQFVERKMQALGLPKETFDPMFSAAVPDYEIDLRRGTDNAGVAPYQDPALVRDADPELLKRSPATLSHEFEHQLAGKAAMRYAGLPAEKTASQAAKNYVALRKMEREDPAKAAEINAMMAVSPPVYFMQQNMQSRGLSEAEAKQAFKELKDEFGRPELAKYLMEKFPAQKEIGRIGRPGQPLHEYLADLSGLETRFRTDLTKDPYIRRYVFGNDDKLIEDYKAVTGLRQERLDAKDLPPYTPQYGESKAQGMLDWIKSKVRRRADGSPEYGEISPEGPFYGEQPSESKSMLDEALTAGAKNIHQFFADPKSFHTRAAKNIQQTLEQNPADFAANFMTPAGSLAGVIKPKGGTWLSRDVNQAISRLIPKDPRFIDIPVEGDRYIPMSINPTSSQYQQSLEKALADLEAGADPQKVYKSTISYLVPPEVTGGRTRSAKEPTVAEQAGMVKRLIEEQMQAIAPKVALDNWINKTLGRYVSRDMATPEDPVRKLIDQNMAIAEESYAIGKKRIAKLEADIAKAKAEGKGTTASEQRLENLRDEVEGAYARAMESPLPGGEVTRYLNQPGSTVSSRRIEGGFPEEGLAKSQAAKFYEEWADYAITPRSPSRILERKLEAEFSPEQLDALRKNNETVYTAPYLDLRDAAPFRHLVDELDNALTGQNNLPEALTLTPNDLSQMGLEKAFRHVQRIDDWRYAQKAQSDLEKSGRSVETIKTYDGAPNGLKWVQIKKVGEGTEAEQALADALKYEGSTMGHCVGGYCPDVLSGESQIFSLRDRRGMPHVTIEVRPPDVRLNTPLDFLQENPSMADRFGVTVEGFEGLNDVAGPDWRAVNQTIIASPEYQKWLAAKPPVIEQIKGKGNGKPKEDYIPYVQDFIKSKEWSMVGDLNYTDMTPLKPQMLSSLKKRGINPDVLYTDSNGTAYISKSEFERLAKEMSPAERNSVSSNASFSRQLRGEE